MQLDNLKQKVAALYQQKLPTRDEWADWLYDNHVLVVTRYAKALAEKYDANAELSQAAALLHDIADYKMERSEPNHEAESLTIARQLMQECDFSRDAIALTVDNAIRYHSCYDNDRPKSKEGLILATADSLAHLKTDFYVFATHAMGTYRTLDETKQWVLTKIERDLYNKISFDDERSSAQADYELLKKLYSR